MKCPHCGAQWSIPGQEKIWGECPFCGKSLQPQRRPPETLEAALLEIASSFGQETLKDGRKTVGLFADLAPQLEKEKRLLKYFVEANRLEVLFAMKSKPTADQLLCYRKTFLRMVDDWSMREDAAQLVCSSYFRAVGIAVAEVSSLQTAPAVQTPPAAASGDPGKPAAVKTAPSAAPGKKSPQPKPAPPKTDPAAQSKKPTPVNGYGTYLKALEQYYLDLIAAGQATGSLNTQQIEHFVYSNRLHHRWGITPRDVETDLQNIYAKYSSGSIAPPKPAAPIPKPNKKIRTYSAYMAALTDLYLDNGKQMPTDGQIVVFLRQYELDRFFGIAVWDVRKDLDAIRSQYG